MQHTERSDEKSCRNIEIDAIPAAFCLVPARKYLRNIEIVCFLEIAAEASAAAAAAAAEGYEFGRAGGICPLFQSSTHRSRYLHKLYCTNTNTGTVLIISTRVCFPTLYMYEYD